MNGSSLVWLDFAYDPSRSSMPGGKEFAPLASAKERDFDLVSVGDAFRLSLRKGVNRLASVNNFLLYYFQRDTFCL